MLHLYLRNVSAVGLPKSKFKAFRISASILTTYTQWNKENTYQAMCYQSSAIEDQERLCYIYLFSGVGVVIFVTEVFHMGSANFFILSTCKTKTTQINIHHSHQRKNGAILCSKNAYGWTSYDEISMEETPSSRSFSLEMEFKDRNLSI